MFDAGRTGFDSEIWGDAEQLMQAFRRHGYSVARRSASTTRRASTRSSASIEADPRLTLDAKRERTFYADQSEALVEFHQLPRHDALDHLLDRRDHRRDDHDVCERRDRARRRSARCARSASRAAPILVAFLFEALLLGCVGGVVGLVGLASFMQLVPISTHQLPVVRRARVHLHAHARHRRRVARVRAGRWASSADSCPRRAPRA